jgi:hypothetical protein
MSALEDGHSYRDILEGLLVRTKSEERRAEIEAELFGVTMPEALGYLWVAFVRLRRRKGSNGFALSPIEWTDIAAFIQLSGVALAPWEISVIEDLDDIFIESQQPKAPGK